MDFSWLLVALAAGSAAVGAIESTRIFLRNRRSQARFARPPRPQKGQGARLLIDTLLDVFAFLVGYHLGPWQPTDLGVSLTVSPALALAAGLLAYPLYYLLFYFLYLLLRACGINILTLADTPEDSGLCTLWPRHRREKPLACVSVCLLDPITEELLHRGVLVYGLGILVGSHVATALLGLPLALVTHLYQGRSALAQHLVIYMVMVGLLFSPLGLVGAIGFHLATNVISVLTMKWQMNNWVRARRSSRGSGGPAA